MHVDPQVAMTHYLSRLRPDADNRYRREAQRFLSYSAGDFSRDTLVAYIEQLKSSDYAPTTITRVMVPTVRRLFKANGQEWPLLPGEAPKVKESDIYNPALDPALVAKLIATARGGGVSRTAKALMALSTIYGVRRIEMASIRPQDIDLHHGTLFVRTAKGGRERWHLIPEEIKPYLDIPWKQPSTAKVTRAYQAIEAAAGVQRMYEIGWHAIRRILVRMLVIAGVPDMMVRNFMRWKRGGSDMQWLYFSSPVVGEGGERTVASRLDTDVDLAVFKVHPFLQLWR